MTDAKIEKLKHAGVPDNFIREIEQARKYRLLRWSLKVLVLLLLVSPVIVLSIVGATTLETFNRSLIADSPHQVDAYLLMQNGGIGALVGVFGWIFLSGAIGALIVRLLRGPHRLAGLYAMIEKEKIWSIDTRALCGALAKTSPSDNAIDFAGIAATHYASIMALISAPFILFAVISTLNELGDYTLASDKGMYRADIDTLVAWNDIAFVEVGCNKTKNDNMLIFSVHFRDGLDVNLASGTPLNGKLLDGLERANRKLTESDVKFQLWNWLNRDPMHPRCLNYYKRHWSTKNFQRLKSILHVAELTPKS